MPATAELIILSHVTSHDACQLARQALGFARSSQCTLYSCVGAELINLRLPRLAPSSTATPCLALNRRDHDSSASLTPPLASDSHLFAFPSELLHIHRRHKCSERQLRGQSRTTLCGKAPVGLRTPERDRPWCCQGLQRRRQPSIALAAYITTFIRQHPPNSSTMPTTTAETLSLVTRNVSVAPLVLLSAVDHYNRTVQNKTKRRVVGVLLGQNDGKNVRVSNSFAGT